MGTRQDTRCQIFIRYAPPENLCCPRGRSTQSLMRCGRSATQSPRLMCRTWGTLWGAQLCACVPHVRTQIGLQASTKRFGDASVRAGGCPYSATVNIVPTTIRGAVVLRRSCKPKRAKILCLCGQGWSRFERRRALLQFDESGDAGQSPPVLRLSTDAKATSQYLGCGFQ